MTGGRNNASTHAALTGLRAFWPDSRAVWLVSPGCIPQPALETGNAQVAGVLPFPWTHADLPELHEELRARYDDVLTFLVDNLNQLHGVRRSKTYWHLVVGPWVFSFVNLISHHHATLRLAQRNLGPIDTIGLAEESYVTPATTLEFLYEASDDLYNHQLYTRIAGAMGVPITEYRRAGAQVRLSSSDNPENLPSHREPLARRIQRRVLHEFHKRTEGFFAARADFLFRRSRLPENFERRLVGASGWRIWVHHGAPYKPASREGGNPLSEQMRQQLEGYAGVDEPGRLVGELMSREIPRVFVENYADLVSYSGLVYGEHWPRIVLSTVAWHYDVAFTHFAGTRAEAGSCLVGGQEAGSFGVEANSQVERFERSLTDLYLTWGWTDKADPRCIPSTATRLVETKERNRLDPGDGILYVGTVALRFPVIARPDFSNYFELQRRFFNAVEPDLRREFRVRAHTADFGWGVKRRLVSAFPELRIEEWNRPFTDSLQSSRLYVCDHLSTTFTEALASNIPTVIFWDPVFFAIRDSARPFFDRLRLAGVVHDSPEDAATWIARVYPDVQTWWFNAETQQAVGEFRDEFARTTADPLGDWLRLIRRLLVNADSA